MGKMQELVKIASKYKFGDPRRVRDHQIAFMKNSHLPIWQRRGMADTIVNKAVLFMVYSSVGMTLCLDQILEYWIKPHLLFTCLSIHVFGFSLSLYLIENHDGFV